MLICPESAYYTRILCSPQNFSENDYYFKGSLLQVLLADLIC